LIFRAACCILSLMVKVTFSFGRNWRDFMRSLNEERFREAERSLVDFLRLDNLQGLSFLDIGCGSGLFSYAAFRLGAAGVVSFDADPFSVECCRHLYGKANSPDNWEIYDGSVLDADFLSGLGRFDIVYSWGVLHHTGRMWEAIRNSAKLVKKGGYYYIALYRKTSGMFGSGFWLKVKEFYNFLPPAGKWFLEVMYMAAYFAVNFIRLKNPLAQVRNYRSARGMNWRRDVTDWLGGYPYEFASKKEVLDFMRKNFPSFKPVNAITAPSALANNWYLFRNA